MMQLMVSCALLLLIATIHKALVILDFILKAIISGTDIDAFFQKSLVSQRLQIFYIC